ncbi:MAG: hypothetical protein IJX85_01290 [Lachnospiraceae bacterium]|nr:hypothetical protein [Lachnospiraceae bacterium]
MNDYFKQLQKDNKPMSITLDQISDYKESVIREMELMGARSEDIALLDDIIVITSIQNHHQPKDLAWAMMQ